MFSNFSFPSLFEQQSSLEASSSNHEQQSEIAGLPLEIETKILTNLNPSAAVNREFRDLSKSPDQQKFPIIIGEIIFSYLGADEIPSVEGEFTLSDSIEFIKERDRSEINTKSKKFSDLIRKQFEQELKNKEISENYKELLESIEKIVPSDVTLKVIKVLDLKKKIEFFLLLKDLLKERIEVLQKTCQDQSLLEFFQEVFNWIKKYQENRKEIYPTREIEKFIKLSVQNNKEEMVIEIIDKIPESNEQDSYFVSIIEALVEWKGSDEEIRKHYDKAIELANRISVSWRIGFLIIVRGLVKWEGNDQEKSERYAEAIKLASKIKDKRQKSRAFLSIVEGLIKWEGNDQEKKERFAKVRELITKISDIQIQCYAAKSIVEGLVKWKGNDKEENERCAEAIEWIAKISDLKEQLSAFKSFVEVLVKWEGREKEISGLYIKMKEIADKISHFYFRDKTFELLKLIEMRNEDVIVIPQEPKSRKRKRDSY